jgi:hypothetical protein
VAEANKPKHVVGEDGAVAAREQGTPNSFLRVLMKRTIQLDIVVGAVRIVQFLPAISHQTCA